MSMKKTFTGKEFYDFLQSYDHAVVCHDTKDFNGVFVRFDPRRLTITSNDRATMISTELDFEKRETGGCVFFGNEFYCDIETDEADIKEWADMKVTTDWCKEPYTVCLKNF